MLELCKTCGNLWVNDNSLTGHFTDMDFSSTGHFIWMNISPTSKWTYFSTLHRKINSHTILFIFMNFSLLQKSPFHLMRIYPKENWIQKWTLHKNWRSNFFKPYFHLETIINFVVMRQYKVCLPFFRIFVWAINHVKIYQFSRNLDMFLKHVTLVCASKIVIIC